MKEQLVGFKVAKLAKEKGFNLINNTFYCDNYKGLCIESEEFLSVESLTNGIYDCNNEFDEGERYSAPTQSLLQKWLREVHKINIFITLGYGWEWNVGDKKDGTYNTYEEPLEVGLIEALKLIKDV